MDRCYWQMGMIDRMNGERKVRVESKRGHAGKEFILDRELGMRGGLKPKVRFASEVGEFVGNG